MTPSLACPPRFMKSIFLLLFSVLLITVPAVAQTGLRVGASAPDFSASSLTGDQFELAKMRGKVVVLSFWSTRCEICRVEFPRINQLAARLPGDKVVFLAPTMENETIVSAFVRRNPARFDILPNSFGLLLQYADRTKDGSIDMGFPSFFVIDQQGLVQYRGSGYGRIEPLSQAVDRLVAGSDR
jgi:peroxiredoxin